jgi:hypothetical protein
MRGFSDQAQFSTSLEQFSTGTRTILEAELRVAHDRLKRDAAREDMSNSYTITCYPQAHPNENFRKITVEIVSDPGKKYRVHSRPG